MPKKKTPPEPPIMIDSGVLLEFAGTLRDAVDKELTRMELRGEKNPSAVTSLRAASTAFTTVCDKIAQMRQEVRDEAAYKEKEGEADSIPLEQIGLSARPYNSLDRHGIRTAGDILKLKRADVRNITSFGAGCEKEVREKLLALGFKWNI